MTLYARFCHVSVLGCKAPTTVYHMEHIDFTIREKNRKEENREKRKYILCIFNPPLLHQPFTVML